MSEETRKKISLGSAGTNNGMFGKHHKPETIAIFKTPKTKEHIEKIVKKRKKNENYYNENHAWFGSLNPTNPLSPHYDKWLKNVREANKDIVRIKSAEVREKISKALKGKPKTEEHKRKLSEALKGKPSAIKGKSKTAQHKMNLSISKKTSGKYKGNKNSMSYVSIMDRYKCSLDEAKVIRKELMKPKTKA